MVSGFVTSPDDQSRICFDDARPMRIASKSLMSIKVLCAPLYSFLEFQIREVAVGDRPHLRLRLLLGLLARRLLHVAQVAQLLVVRERHLAVLVDALLALLELLGGGLASGRPERARRQVDAEL